MKIQKSMRAPSYKAIACALLQNDVALKTLGYWPEPSKYYFMLKDMESSR